MRWPNVRSRLPRAVGEVHRRPEGQAESLREEVKAVCWARGRQVEAHFTDGTTLTGEAIGLNEDASLILRTQDARTIRSAPPMWECCNSRPVAS